MILRATVISQADIGVLAVLQTNRTATSTKMTGEEKRKNMKKRIFVCTVGG